MEKKLLWNKMKDGLYYRGFRFIPGGIYSNPDHIAIYENEEDLENKTEIKIPTIENESDEKLFDRIRSAIDTKANEIGLPSSVKCLKVFTFDGNELKSECNKDNKSYELDKIYGFSYDMNLSPYCGKRGFHTYFTVTDAIESYCCVCEMSGLYDVNSGKQISWEFMKILEKGLSFKTRPVNKDTSDTEFITNCMKSRENTFKIPSSKITDLIGRDKETQIVLSFENGQFNLEIKPLKSTVSSYLIICKLYSSLVYGIKRPEYFDYYMLNDDEIVKLLKKFDKGYFVDIDTD